MRNNPCGVGIITPDMKFYMYALLALILAVPFAKPANAQVVVIGHPHHHRHYHHHHHYYHH